MIGISASRRDRRARRSLTLAAGLAIVLATAAVAAATAGGAPTATAAATADMSVQKSVDRNPARVGDRLTYEVLVTNLGPGVATNVVGADRLPPEVKFESATVSKGGPCFVTSLVQCPIGEIGSGETQTMTIVVTLVEEPFEGIFITNFASVFSDDDPDDSNDHTEHKTEVVDGGGGGDKPCIPEAAFTDLDSMDNVVRKLREKSDDLSKKKVKRRTKQVDRLKLDMLEQHFPDVFGAAFIDLFLELENIDDQMSDARRLFGNQFHDIGKDFKRARKSIRTLQRLLEASGAPEGILTDLDIMDNVVRKLQEKSDGLSRDQVKKRTKQVDRLKLDMLEEHFSEVCGIPFIDLFLELENIDDQMSDARRLFGNKFHDIDKDFKRARKSIRTLEGLLEGAQ